MLAVAELAPVRLELVPMRAERAELAVPEQPEQAQTLAEPAEPVAQAMADAQQSGLRKIGFITEPKT